jgi:ribosomal protein S18 acetylase RimI-like enzyme
MNAVSFERMTSPAPTAATGRIDASRAGDVEAITAGHNARMSMIDRLIPPAPAPVLTPVPDPAPAYGVKTEQLLVGPYATGIARLSTVDPESLPASWGSLTSVTLVGARIADDGSGGAGASAAMDALLSQWATWTSAQAIDLRTTDSGAGLVWPSRDTAMTLAFLRHGLTPTVHVAARPAGRPSPPTPIPHGLVIRDLGERDVDSAALLQVEVIRWDAQFGGVTLRPSSAARARDDVAGQLTKARTSAWVAELDGAIVGLLTLDWPPETDWISRLAVVDPSRLAYLGCLSIAPEHRSGGIGAALARFIHAEVDTAGIELTLLHHSATNPLSTPFWNRWNYRPLWTGWDVRPHTWLR